MQAPKFKTFLRVPCRACPSCLAVEHCVQLCSVCLSLKPKALRSRLSSFNLFIESQLLKALTQTSMEAGAGTLGWPFPSCQDKKCQEREQQYLSQHPPSKPSADVSTVATSETILRLLLTTLVLLLRKPQMIGNVACLPGPDIYLLWRRMNHT